MSQLLTRKSRALLLFLGSVFCVAQLRQLYAGTVSRKAPRAFRRELSAQLTPLEEVLAAKMPAQDGASGIVLLDEGLRSVDRKGRRITAIHRAYQVKDEAGVGAVSTARIDFRINTHKIHLVLAHSVQPDGTKVPVRDEAVTIRHVQSRLDQSMLTDVADLVIIFPDVRPETVVGYVVA